MAAQLEPDPYGRPAFTSGALDLKPPARRHLPPSVQATGLSVRLRVRGGLSTLPRALDRSLCRVVQQSLTTAFKPGGASEVDVRLDLGGTRVELEVSNALGTG